MNVFISALDWGLGHATRTIPVIDAQLRLNRNVIIGASINQIGIYKEHFPALTILTMPSVPPVYSKSNIQFIAFAKYLPQFFKQITAEHHYLNAIVDQYNIHMVISDNCYGLYNRKTRNILITHQLSLKTPRLVRLFKGIIQNKLNQLINNFDYCYVPDYSGKHKLSGELSRNTSTLKCLIRFIGPLSRLSVVKEEHKEIYPKLLILISGPENQRTQFEEKILESIPNLPKNLSYLIIRGLPMKQTSTIKNSLNHATAPKLKAYIKNAKYIVSRAGYSTIMDLVELQKTAMLVPTPGQPEQIYLAKHLSQQSSFLSTEQEKVDLTEIITQLNTFKPNRPFQTEI